MSAPSWPLTADAAEITVPDLGCGHLPGESCDEACAYWRGVADGTYPPPEFEPVTLPPHCPGLVPLPDPALREVA
ncbi:hypothetical protein [Salinispora tropica]|uniref:Uncharacterized protein n=1 Tax=Salinispora tropica (strain ATCC BAA-916 / DSM 44818 / JCM 13857 / NBRC 105044 / CNB-440) TaxID=369723 RepID=A4XBY4_SALTO|nr:hypothetical protein [Salinispora tropica]ABP56441.1 hypothetical protein Strop_4011 [Salinispora tropica CNB-440]